LRRRLSAARPDGQRPAAGGRGGRHRAGAVVLGFARGRPAGGLGGGARRLWRGVFGWSGRRRRRAGARPGGARCSSPEAGGVTPHQAKSAYGRMLDEVGEPVVIRQYSGTGAGRAVSAEATVQARVTEFSPSELVGSIVQGDRNLIVVADDLPGTAITLP